MHLKADSTALTSSPLTSLFGAARAQPQPRQDAPDSPPLLSIARAPTLVVVGQGRRAAAVRERLRVLQVEVVVVPWTVDLDEAQLKAAAGQVLVEPAGRRAPARLRDHLAGAARETLPTLVVLSQEPTRSRVARLYREGASAVFTWPREKELLPWCLAELLAIRRARGPASRADTALARTVRARLRWLAGPKDTLRVALRDGHASLSGSVSTLPAKRELEDAAWCVPGVCSVDVDDLRVDPDPAISSSDLLRAIGRVLRCAPELDARTLTVSVDGGVATIAGAVKSKQQLRRMRELCERVRGLRGLELLAVVEPGQQRRDRLLARRLQELVSAIHGGDAVKVTAFGGTVVLTGRVDSPRHRRSLEAFVRDADDVLRVVNKVSCP